MDNAMICATRAQDLLEKSKRIVCERMFWIVVCGL